MTDGKIGRFASNRLAYLQMGSFEFMDHAETDVHSRDTQLRQTKKHPLRVAFYDFCFSTTGIFPSNTTRVTVVNDMNLFIGSKLQIPFMDGKTWSEDHQ